MAEMPDLEDMYLPLLKYIADGRTESNKTLEQVLADEFQLSEEDRQKLLVNGRAFVFPYRLGWTRTFLKKAGLITYPKRGTVAITSRGQALLQTKPARITHATLLQYPEFADFYRGSKESTTESTSGQNANESTFAEIQQTPLEVIEKGYQTIRTALAQDLLETVLQMSPRFFERLVIDLLVKMGYGGSIKDAGEAIGRSGDEGIDGTIKEDKLGLDIIYVQAKRYQPGNMIGRPHLQGFVGALAGQGAKKGIFITTSSFTKEAREYVPRNETKIVLIDGQHLTQLMIDYNIGVAPDRSYELKKIDNDYFEEGG